MHNYIKNGENPRVYLLFYPKGGSIKHEPTSNDDDKLQIIHYNYHTTKLPTNPKQSIRAGRVRQRKTPPSEKHRRG